VIGEEPVKRGPGRPKGSTNSKSTEEERAKERERYHRKKQRANASKQTGEVQSRMGRVIDRLIERQEGRGDLELAGILREDGEMMANTTADAVKVVPQLAAPLLLILGLIEPFLAFGRLAGLFRHRLLERRERAAEAAAQEIVEEELAQQPTPVGVYQQPNPDPLI